MRCSLGLIFEIITAGQLFARACSPVNRPLYDDTSKKAVFIAESNDAQLGEAKGFAARMRVRLVTQS